MRSCYCMLAERGESIYPAKAVTTEKLPKTRVVVLLVLSSMYG